MAPPPDREYESIPLPAQSFRGEEPLLVGIIGPPGSGKTRSVLRLAHGVQAVRSGPVVLIDTEAGRSKKYSPKRGEVANPAEGTYDFQRIDLEAPFRSDRFLEAIHQAQKTKPAAIIVDNLSDEHLGEGGYLEWHESEIARMGGNEYGAWARPAGARKRLASGIAHTTVPMFFTFIAQEKTEQVDDPKKPGKKKVIQLGWMPVAPLVLVKVLDLTCILPYDSKGTPIWKSRDLPGEDFIRKWPEYLLKVMKEGQLTEAHGEALARWALGDAAKGEAQPQGLKVATGQPGATAGQRKAPPPEVEGGPTSADLLDLNELLLKHLGDDRTARGAAIREAFGTHGTAAVKLPREQFLVGFAALKKTLEGLAAMRGAMREPAPAGQAERQEAPREREPGEDDGDE